MTSNGPRGLLLFAHGARDPRWAAPFEAVASGVRDGDRARMVELAFLEFMSPDFTTAATRLAARCATVDVVPLFLGAGGHVRKDLPALVAAMQATHPAVQWRLHPPIGEQAEVIAAIAAATLALGDAGAAIGADDE